MKFIKVPRADDQHFLIIKVHDVFQYGQDFGDEYFAELDLIEVVERNKEGYESDIDDDDDDFEVEALDDALETFDSSR